MTTRIDNRFRELRKQGRKGFIAFVTAGDPSLAATRDIVLRLEDAGADIVELGIPFSDPLADGRVNQESAARALAGGATLPRVLQLIAAIRRSSQVPLLCYTYMNPVHALGAARVVREAADAGLDGLLILDLPVEESGPYAGLLRRHRINNIPLVTPTTPGERIGRIVQKASGFVYCVSREGVTGAQTRLSPGAFDLVRRTKQRTHLPVAIGFGISTPGHAAAAAQAADAVVVGSAIVNKFHTSPHTPAGRKAAARWVGRLVRAVKEVT